MKWEKDKAVFLFLSPFSTTESYTHSENQAKYTYTPKEEGEGQAGSRAPEKRETKQGEKDVGYPVG